jgi:hypothetical protein
MKMEMENIETENIEVKKGWYKYLFIVLGLVILLSVIIILSISAQHSQAEQRHHLFCEEIKMGMSEAEVLQIMGRFGEFGIAKFDSSEDTVMVSVQPIVNDTTSKIYGSGGLELYFRKGLLTNVIERRHLEDGIYELCK